MLSRDAKPISIYVHVPFCRARCLYCGFTSRPAGPSTQTQYIEGLCEEISAFFANNPGYHVETVYIGGGTPSTLGIGDIQLLLKTIRSIAPDAIETTLEANPHPDDIPKLRILNKGGINRLSIGVQSFNDEELSLAGRMHSSGDTRKFIKKCQKLSSCSLSFDLIHGLPSQTIDSFCKSIEEAVSYKPDHVSLYGLSIETASRLGRLPECQFKSLAIPDGDDQAEMYDLARKVLKDAGYIQYEISNFALPDKWCRHNMVYWTGGDYIGFGPAAASFIDGRRFRRLADVDAYMSAQSERKNTVEITESLSIGRAAAEALVLGLRVSEGCSRSRIENKYGVKLANLVGEALDKYRDQGFLEINDDTIKLTDRAYFVSNTIFSDIVQ